MSRVASALAALALAMLVLAGCGGSLFAGPAFLVPSRSLASPSLPCRPQPRGALCLKVFKESGKVGDVIAYLSASGSPLTGRTWRLDLTYGRSASFPTRAHHGNPLEVTSCRDSQGHTVTTGNGCHDTLAEAVATFGDFRGLRMPMASVPVPLCVREQVLENGRWVAGPARQACVP